MGDAPACLQEFEAFIEKGGSVEASDDQGRSLLLCYVLAGMPDLVQAALHRGADANARNKRGDCVLNIAIGLGSVRQLDRKAKPATHAHRRACTACTQTRTRTRTHTHTHTRTHARTHTHTDARTHARTHTHTHTQMLARNRADVVCTAGTSRSRSYSCSTARAQRRTTPAAAASTRTTA